MVGDTAYLDYFRASTVRDNHLLIVTTSVSTEYTDALGTTDIHLYQLRVENGYKSGSVVIGSPSDDQAFDIQSDH